MTTAERCITHHYACTGPRQPCINLGSGAARHRNHIERVERYREGLYSPVLPVATSEKER